MERCYDYRSACLRRPYTSICRDATKDECFKFCWISSLMIFERFSHLKYKYGNRHFWCRGFYVDTVGRNQKAIEEYIRNQEREDMISDQISFKEYNDPFKGSK